jgi:Zn-dependent metalloprotease
VRSSANKVGSRSKQLKPKQMIHQNSHAKPVEHLEVSSSSHGDFNDPCETNTFVVYNITSMTSDDYNIEKLYDCQNNTFPYGRTELDLAITTMLYSDNLYSSLSNGQWVSYKGEPASIDVYLNYQDYNAFYDGDHSFVIGRGLSVDDVIGHEYHHGVTEYTCGLIYEYQVRSLVRAIC